MGTFVPNAVNDGSSDITFRGADRASSGLTAVSPVVWNNNQHVCSDTQIKFENMAVTLNNLRSQRNRRKAEFLGHTLLDFRVDIGVSPHRTGELADGNRLFGMLHTVNIAFNFRTPQSHLQAKSHGLGVNAMGSANAGRMLEFHGTAAQNLTEFAQII